MDAAVEQLKEVHQERLCAAVNDLASTQAAAAAAAAASKNSNEDQSAGKSTESRCTIFQVLHVNNCNVILSLNRLENK